MIISSPLDFREAARRKLPPFLFHYIDGGAYAEHTLRRNVEDLADIALRQRVLKNMAELDLSTQAVRRAPGHAGGPLPGRPDRHVRPPWRSAGSRARPQPRASPSPCPPSRSARSRKWPPAIDRPMWFQLYVLKDRGFMRNALERAKAAGVTTLVFTVDMPVPGARYRDAHSGMTGPHAPLRRMLQAMTHPAWAWDVGLLRQTARPGQHLRLPRQSDRAGRLHRLAGRKLRPVDLLEGPASGSATSGTGRW